MIKINTDEGVFLGKLKLSIVAVLVGVWENINLISFFCLLCMYLVILVVCGIIKNPEEVRKFFEEW